MAPLPAAANVCGLVVELGDTTKTTLAAAMQQYTGMSPDEAVQQAQAQQPQPAPV